MTDPTQDLIERLRFAAMDTLNRDQVRTDARAAADWIAAAHRRTHSPGLALSEAADCIVRQVFEIERLREGVVQREAELIYLRLHGKDGALWSANHSKSVWLDKARVALDLTHPTPSA